jgi:uncharacterized membrane protein SpoIIM required for sporulation
MSDFVTRNKPDWDELQRLVQRARRSLRRMSPDEIRRLDELSRRVAVHLAQVSTRTSDARLARYLNDLLAGAHSVLYLPPRHRVWRHLVGFLADGFARLIVRNGRFHLASLALLVGGGLLAFVASLRDPLTIYALMPAGDVRQPGSTPEQLLEVLRSGRDGSGGEKFFFASFLFTHNLRVALTSLALGILAAVPTVLLILYNGMLLGAFAAMHHRAGITTEMWAWILPHGITEMGAIVLCGGLGLRLGWAVVCPGRAPRMESIRRAGNDAALTCIGVALMLVFAGIIESYLRQSHLSTTARLAFAAGTALFWIVYVVHGTLRERRALVVPAAGR